MINYNIQYTISVLSGAYAQKYSVVIFHAQRMKNMFERYAPELKDLVALNDNQKAEFDPYMVFQAIMKLMKYLAKHRNLMFCDAIEKSADRLVTVGDEFEDENDSGVFHVRAYGESGILETDGRESSFEILNGKNASYRAIIKPVLTLFKDDLMNMLNLCEETMAKDGKLVARQVPDDIVPPAPLFQL